jgi:hypothetical protein
MADASDRRAPRREPMASRAWPSDADDSSGRAATTRHDNQARERRAVDDAAWLLHAPTPLMPASPGVEAAETGAIRSVSTTPSAMPSPRNAEPSEVHVTIGRIEITAVHEAAPPRRAGKAARPLTSLDDYLRQRQGGR